MSYFVSNKLVNVLYNIKVIVFLNSYDKVFNKVIERKFSLIKKPRKEDKMVEILQMIIIDRAFDARVPEKEIEIHLVNPEAFRGWIKVALQEADTYHRELVYKYRNDPETLEFHRLFMKSLEILAEEYNTENYLNCLLYFDQLWDNLSYKLN
jgi:hypothetical protein